MTGRIADATLWREGAERIAWAREFMPATTAIAAELTDSGRVRGVRIAVSDVLEPKTATVALLLAEAGADVVVSCVGRDTDDAVAAALVHAGIPTYAQRNATEADDRDNVLALLDHHPDVIVDDGAGTIRLAHTARPDILAAMAGATEQTTSGVRPLRTMERLGELRIPIIAANDARTKSLFDNAHGTGQSVVLAVADLLDEPWAGIDVVVVGFGRVGSGVARHAAALGARVTVTEVDPVAALQAVFAGYAVEPLADAAGHADVLISTTGIAHTVTAAHLERLPDGAAVAVGGGAFQEISLLNAREAGAEEVARQGAISVLRLPNGRRIRVLDDGHCINVSAAEGNPIQVMDLSFGIQLAAVEHLLASRGTLSPTVHILPAAADDRVAALALGAFRGGLDAVSDAQRDYLTSWIPRDIAP
ncbi:adenosylhomocysteinase [Microbacterium sp. EST19A]|uniref:adenosylhomocysteinase n=1 Tax=Microbacterium sp. EST19A TaxID=2862681 RepID=UPI001CBF1DA2|nr:adenosylhomocysteinase [Microbacterium sp. EST19A]